MMENEEALRVGAGVAVAIGIVFWSIVWIYILRFFIGLLKLISHSNSTRGTIVDNQGVSRSGADYSHPCVEQCLNQNVVLNKSPTPMYKHNCRAPCGSATRSGRYYKGKRGIQTW